MEERNWIIGVLLTFYMIENVNSIGCFVCKSINGSDSRCEDSFFNIPSRSYFQDPCMANMKGRGGVYPASTCLKISGFYETGENVVMRSCGVDSGTLTADTEIVRLSHCGSMILDGRYIHGCLEVCDDVDGCNHAQDLTKLSKNLLQFCILTMMIYRTFT